jgi:hypothetical protein
MLSSTRRLEEAAQNPNTAPVDEQTVQRIERVVARCASNRPIHAEAFRRIEHFLDDNPWLLPCGGGERGSQVVKVGERIEQAVHVIDAQAVNDVLRGELQDQVVTVREHILVFGVRRDQLIDSEEAAID